MNPPSSGADPDPVKTEDFLTHGILPPPPERTADFQHQQDVENALRGLAVVQPPDMEPSVSATWQHSVHYASLLQNLNKEGAAVAEAVISGTATSAELHWWREQTLQSPELAAAGGRARPLDRALSQLPEVVRPPVPPEILAGFRQALAGMEKPPVRLRHRTPWISWFVRHPLFTSLAMGAAAVLMVTVWNSRRISPGGNPSVADAGHGISRDNPVTPATPGETGLSVSSAPVETASRAMEEARIVQPNKDEKPTVAAVPETVPEFAGILEPGQPPPGSMEALRPVFLAQLGGHAAAAGMEMEMKGTGRAGLMLRNGQDGAVPGTVLRLVFRHPGSPDLTDSGDETFPALAAALADPVLADEPWFLVEDHSNNDLNISLARASRVCGILTQLGVPAARLRASGKGRFELRADDGRDGRASRMSIRPATLNPAGTGAWNR